MRPERSFIALDSLAKTAGSQMPPGRDYLLPYWIRTIRRHNHQIVSLQIQLKMGGTRRARNLLGYVPVLDVV